MDELGSYGGVCGLRWHHKQERIANQCRIRTHLALKLYHATRRSTSKNASESPQCGRERVASQQPR